MMMTERGYVRSVATLVFAIICLSTSVIFIRLSTLPPMQLSAYRLLGAAVVLAPLFFRDWRAEGREIPARRWTATLLPGLVLGAHLVLWVVGARLTLAANAVLAVNMVPAVLPLFLWPLVGEKVTRRELGGTLLGLVGLAVLTSADFRLGGDHWKGDVTCFGAMLLLALYLALGRRNRATFPTNWLYMVPVYGIAGGACFVAAIVTGERLVVPSPADLWPVAGLIVLPTICGHGLVAWSLRSLRGQVVGVFNQGQFISSGLLAFAVFGELPLPSFLPASVLVVAGAIVAGMPRRRRGSSPACPAA